MEINNGLAILLIALIFCVGIFAGFVLDKPETITKTVEVETIVEVAGECSSELESELVCPEVSEYQMNEEMLFNQFQEFLGREFENESNEIKVAAEPLALLELEDHDYRVVVDHLMSLVEGIDVDELEDYLNDLKEDDFEVEVKVLMLGLEDEADKSARVTFELEVEYELEEGVRETYEKDLVVVYNVFFEEGDFGDEEVELVSIV